MNALCKHCALILVDVYHCLDRCLGEVFSWLVITDLLCAVWIEVTLSTLVDWKQDVVWYSLDTPLSGLKRPHHCPFSFRWMGHAIDYGPFKETRLMTVWGSCFAAQNSWQWLCCLVAAIVLWTVSKIDVLKCCTGSIKSYNLYPWI